MFQIRLFKYCVLVAMLPLILVGCASQGQQLATARQASNPAPRNSTTTGIVTSPVATTGCGLKPPAPPGTTRSMAITSGGIRRTFRFHIPAAYNARRMTPLVFVIHGHGGTASGMEKYTGYSSLADQQNFLVIYPQGVIGPDKQPGWATYGPVAAHIDDVLFFSDLLTFAQHHLCVDASRIYATGLSNGGGMTNLLACRLAGRIAAFVAVAPAIYPLPGGCHPPRPIPFLDFHGTGDSIVPYAGGSRRHFPPVMQFIQEWAQRDGCLSTPTTFFQQKDVTGFTWRGCRDGVQILHYRIDGGGHAWPGAPRSLPPGGTTISATALGWQFFQRYHLPLTL